MSDVPRHSRSRGLWIAIIVILLPAVVLPLVVPLYDKTDPKLGGWPFYFWFQMALILMAAVLTSVAYRVSIIADRREREDKE